MTSRSSRFIVLALVVLLGAGLTFSQTTIPVGPNERHVKPEVNVQDGDTAFNTRLWVLDFKFKNPRLIKVNVPGKGERMVWYLWYQVINNTGQQVTFVPDFELVTKDDRQPMVYGDQILPEAQEAIARIEDPNGYYKIKNSVTISSDPIPPSLPKAATRPVTGVATWIDPNEIDPTDDAATKEKKKALPKLAESNAYSVFVAGLSSGLSVTDPINKGEDPVIRRKTLRLDFQRLGDKYYMKSEEIKFLKSDWLYRASKLDLKLPLLPKKDGDK